MVVGERASAAARCSVVGERSSAVGRCNGNNALKWLCSSNTQMGCSLLLRISIASCMESWCCASPPGWYWLRTTAGSRTSTTTMLRLNRLQKPCTCASPMNREPSNVAFRLSRVSPAHHTPLGPDVVAASAGRRPMMSSCVSLRSSSPCLFAIHCASGASLLEPIRMENARQLKLWPEVTTFCSCSSSSTAVNGMRRSSRGGRRRVEGSRT